MQAMAKKDGFQFAERSLLICVNGIHVAKCKLKSNHANV